MEGSPSQNNISSDPTTIDSELEVTLPEPDAFEEDESEYEDSETSSDSNEWIDPQDNEIATYPKMATKTSCASC